MEETADAFFFLGKISQRKLSLYSSPLWLYFEKVCSKIRIEIPKCICRSRLFVYGSAAAQTAVGWAWAMPKEGTERDRWCLWDWDHQTRNRGCRLPSFITHRKKITTHKRHILHLARHIPFCLSRQREWVWRLDFFFIFYNSRDGYRFNITYLLCGLLLFIFLFLFF